MQIYDQIYQENFERARKEEEERAREAAMKEQQAAWGGAAPGGPPGLQNPGWGANPAGNGWQGMCSLPLLLEPPRKASLPLEAAQLTDQWTAARCNVSSEVDRKCM